MNMKRSEVLIVLGVISILFMTLLVGHQLKKTDQHADQVQLGLVIDCDATPYVPVGWTVVEHQKGGQLEWDPTKFNLYLSKSQKYGRAIVGYKLRKELADQPVLNANVLDYLLVHPELIPGDWKGKVVFFWGTIYYGWYNDLYVRGLDWRGGCHWVYKQLDSSWGGGSPAVVLLK